MHDVITHPAVHAFDAPYSGALRVGDLVFISGTVPVDAEGGLVGAGDLAAQTRQTFENIRLLLEAAGGGFEHVARMNYFLADIGRWAEVAPIRREFLVEPYPASTAVEVTRLVRTEWLIEIEALAIIPQSA
jgi:reactive intermediate/imine deaminase